MTFVLIHGGGSTRRFWDLVRPLLPGPSIAVDFPGRGDRPADLGSVSVDDEVGAVLDDIAAGAPDGDLVLVAHSSGGLVVPGVVAALPDRVSRIVLNAALVPPEGGCGLDGMQPRHAEGLRNAMKMFEGTGDTITLPGPPDDPESFRNAYGGDPLTDAQLTWVVDPVRCVPDTVHHYFQPVFWSKAAHVPVTYVINTRDRPIPTELQREMIGRLPTAPTVVELHGGHLPAVTDPASLVAAIAG